MYDMIVANFRTQVIWFGLGGLVVAILLSYFVAEFNARPLLRLTRVAQQVADGDLRVEKLPSNRKDEIGMLATSVNFMVDNLRTLIQNINQTSAQVAASADDLSASTEQATQASGQITETILTMANGAEDQLMRTRLSAEAIDALAEGLERIAETSVLVTEASMQSAQEAELGNESIQKAVSQMVQIHGTVQESVGGVKQLAARSQEVGKIVEVITGIAAQTNLLALNAAIEAARAGEQGKGFAVVADEVRKLAEQCGESAAQITELIQSIQGEATRATGSMDEVVREVQSGADAVHVAGEAFQRILHSAKQVAGQIQDVTASAQEITANSEQVATSVEEVTRIAKDSADHAQTVAASSEEQSASIEEISVSVESLSRMAHELQQMIRRFQA
jgi:methyl-accepting chemotaxis protein